MTTLRDLTHAQLAAVESSARWTDIVASAGSGKTTVLAARIAHLIGERGVDPGAILALVFTRLAAAEVRAKVAMAVGGWLAQRITISTFHAFASSHVVPAGCRVATEVEADAALRSLYDGPKQRPARGRPGIETLRRSLVAYESDSDSTFTVGEMSAIDLVRHRLKEAHLVPTWDLIPMLLDKMQEVKVGFFEHVLVDERQDVSWREGEVATWLLHGNSELFTVGDPNQAIFGWRGAAIGDPFAGNWLNVEPVRLPLARTFRFGRSIAELANRIAAQWGGAMVEPAPDVESTVVNGEGRIAGDVLSRGVLAGFDLGQTAILCRDHLTCAAIVSELGDEAAVHVKRDPYLDVDARDGDPFRSIAESGRVAVCTVHSMKAREADAVILALDLNRKHANEEELRVDFTAVTRAKRRLTLLGGQLL